MLHRLHLSVRFITIHYIISGIQRDLPGGDKPTRNRCMYPNELCTRLTAQAPRAHGGGGGGGVPEADFLCSWSGNLHIHDCQTKLHIVTKHCIVTTGSRSTVCLLPFSSCHRRWRQRQSCRVSSTLSTSITNCQSVTSALAKAVLCTFYCARSDV